MICHSKMKVGFNIKAMQNSYFLYIQLIYKNKILEQYDIESDFLTLDMLKNNNNMSFVIVKKKHN